jgi:hypothetical protein
MTIRNVTYIISDNGISVDQTSVELQQQQQQRQQQTDQLLYSSAILNEVSTSSIRKNSRAGCLT